MKFTKMQGAGNDFIVLDNRSGEIRENEYSALAARLCRRRLSIGADGLMIVLPAQGVGDALVPAAARERALAANGIEDGAAGGAKTLEEAGRSGGASFVINGMED